MSWPAVDPAWVRVIRGEGRHELGLSWVRVDRGWSSVGFY